MKLKLIGHRGVGKSKLLERLLIYFPGISAADLDREIEKRKGKTVAEIFSEQGEAAFRKIEQEVFAGLNQQIVVCGAGFDFREANSSGEEMSWVWVRRPTDKLGRIFLDRPRLDLDRSPLQEFQERALEREIRYGKRANFIYDMPEGLQSPSMTEAQIFQALLGAMPLRLAGFLTVQARDANLSIFKFFKPTTVEIRSDLTPQTPLPPDGLFSFRPAPTENQASSLATEASALTAAKAGELKFWDWPCELGAAPAVPSILSCHERLAGESFEQLIERFQSLDQGSHLKLAVEVQNFSELEKGWLWQKQKPGSRSFLPRSRHGRWRWFRLYMKSRQKINFVAFNDQTVLDQPSVYEWQSTTKSSKRFAAVLGSPVSHSRSPVFHQEFFREKEMPFFSIEVKSEEWTEALSILQKMGLVAAAVTSPLKALAFETCAQTDEWSEKFHSVNTLLYDEDRKSWQGWNTDLEGMQRTLSSTIESKQTVIWGGGGTLAMIQHELPEATAYSAREGQPREKSAKHLGKPEFLIWAASPDGEMPNFDWKPATILDLNYREDSRAREYALKVGARYESGEKMFEAQGQAQQKIWEQNLL